MGQADGVKMRHPLRRTLVLSDHEAALGYKQTANGYSAVQVCDASKARLLFESLAHKKYNAFINFNT